MLYRLKFILAFLVSSFAFRGFGQTTIKGHVGTLETRSPLAFATITGPNRTGVIADIDGNFEFRAPFLPCTLNVSLLGYQNTSVVIETVEQPVKIWLKPNPNQLSEVIITPTENPAWRIIRQATQRKEQNNPEKNHRFRYNSYSKMFLTMGTKGPDRRIIDPVADTSLDDATKKTLNKSYLFFTETYATRSYISKNQDKEVILATKVSGFKNPAFGLLSSQLQSFSFYDDLIAVNSKNYLSPLTRNSEDHYRFELLDTTFQNADTVFIITFEPRNGKNFDALKGKVYINTNGYAIQNVVAEPVVKPDGQLDARIQQQYRRINGVWFPEQLNTYLSMVPSKKDKNLLIVGEMRSYITDVELDPQMEKKETRGIASDILSDAAKKDTLFWTQKRALPLSEKEQNTYGLIDSVFKKEKIEQKFNLISYLIDGQVPFGPVGLIFNDVLKINRVESVRIGLGLRTNDRLSKYFNLGGAIGYGVKDKRYKYRADASVFILSDQKLSLNGLYKNDLLESGRTDFEISKLGVTSSEQYRKVFVNRMDQIELKQFSLKSKIGNSLIIEPFYNQQLRVVSGYDYRYRQQTTDGITILRDHFLLEQMGLNIRLAIGEKYARVFNRVLPQGTSRFPLVQFSLSRSKDLQFGNLSFVRADMQLSHQIRIKLGGEINYRINAGYSDASTPYPFLFNPKGNLTTDLVQINSYGSFETMQFNEFVAGRYASAFLYYDLKSLLFKTEKLSPSVILSSSALIGNLANRDIHGSLEAKIPEKIFLESGIQLANLIHSGTTGFGIGAFYQMGHYADPEWQKNLAVKLNVYFILE